MNDDKWEDLIDSVELKFGKLDRKTKKTVETDEMGHSLDTTEEWIEFVTELGRIKLCRTTKPMVIDKKYHYNRSSTGTGHVEYIYSEEDKSQKVKVYRWDEMSHDWSEIPLNPSEMRF